MVRSYKVYHRGTGEFVGVWVTKDDISHEKWSRLFQKGAAFIVTNERSQLVNKDLVDTDQK